MSLMQMVLMFSKASVGRRIFLLVRYCSEEVAEIIFPFHITLEWIQFLDFLGHGPKSLFPSTVKGGQKAVGKYWAESSV